jgi:hypothetical protein
MVDIAWKEGAARHGVQWGVSRELRSTGEGTWDVCDVTVWRMERGAGRAVCTYERRYPGHVAGTFYPFERDGEWFALVSDDYTSTALMSLPSGEIVARTEPGSFGFCPVEFWVPRYTMPSDSDEDSGPFMPFALVSGTVWADDWAWKLQFVDLREIPTDGELLQDDRFGYLPLAGGLQSIDVDGEPKPYPQELIDAWVEIERREASGDMRGRAPSYPEDSKEYRKAVESRMKRAKDRLAEMERGEYFWAEPIRLTVPVMASIALDDELVVRDMHDLWEKPGDSGG